MRSAEGISEFKEGSIEIIQSEEQREKQLRGIKRSSSQRPVEQYQACQLPKGNPRIRGERKRAGKFFEEIMVENLSNFMKTLTCRSKKPKGNQLGKTKQTLERKKQRGNLENSKGKTNHI